jgi:hypothetical protein
MAWEVCALTDRNFQESNRMESERMDNSERYDYIQSSDDLSGVRSFRESDHVPSKVLWVGTKSAEVLDNGQQERASHYGDIEDDDLPF